MASLEYTRPTQGSTGRIGTVLASAFAAVAAWNDARTTRNTLNALSDRELNDIGLSRGDIEDVACGTYRR